MQFGFSLFYLFFILQNNKTLSSHLLFRVVKNTNNTILNDLIVPKKLINILILTRIRQSSYPQNSMFTKGFTIPKIDFHCTSASTIWVFGNVIILYVIIAFDRWRFGPYIGNIILIFKVLKSTLLYYSRRSI